MKEVNYTPAQSAGIDIAKRHLDACVVAGPGPGKTTVPVEYFRRLVASGVDPLRIICRIEVGEAEPQVAAQD